MFLIEILIPIFSIVEDSSSFKFASLDVLKDFFFILKIFTKFSACLTERFFSIILFAINSALINPTKIFAWTAVNFFVSTNFKTGSG